MDLNILVQTNFALYLFFQTFWKYLNKFKNLKSIV